MAPPLRMLPNCEINSEYGAATGTFLFITMLGLFPALDGNSVIEIRKGAAKLTGEVGRFMKIK